VFSDVGEVVLVAFELGEVVLAVVLAEIVVVVVVVVVVTVVVVVVVGDCIFVGETDLLEDCEEGSLDKSVARAGAGATVAVETGSCSSLLTKDFLFEEKKDLFADFL